MNQPKSENVFGIGAITCGDRNETAVVVSGYVCPLSQIVHRHSTPGAAAPDIMNFLTNWERWNDWLRGLDLKPDPTTVGHQSTSSNFARASRSRGISSKPITTTTGRAGFQAKSIRPNTSACFRISSWARALRSVPMAARCYGSMGPGSLTLRSSPRS